MTSKLLSCELLGLEGMLVEIEADFRTGLPAFMVVGLPDMTVQESRQRVESAIKNCDYFFPRGKIIVNLAPADLRKGGPRYDLPIALSVVAISLELPNTLFENILILGELSLEGKVRPIDGILSCVAFAKKRGFRAIMIPKENAHEASLIQGIQIIPVGSLKEAVLHLKKELSLLPINAKQIPQTVQTEIDMALIKGQAQAKRALEIAAAGGHNVLLSGVPGAGKTLLAKAMVGILPSMILGEMIEVTQIYSVAGLLPKSQPLIIKRPFRSIHHTASAVSVVGGGATLKPGEISLAHRGILFMDEIAEFPSETLEVLRQPLEDHKIIISRAKGSAIYPARFTLVAAMNPCPCGYFNSSVQDKICACPAKDIARYQKRISGPLMDRIDLHVQINPVDPESLNEEGTEEPSDCIQKRVEAAAQIQRERYKKQGIYSNGELTNDLLKKFCPLGLEAQKILTDMMRRFNFSARTYFRAIKLGRTLADLAGSEKIESRHVLEALHYKPKYSQI